MNFVDPKLDFYNRNFSGSIVWNETHPSEFGEYARWDFNMTFDQTWTQESGIILVVLKNGEEEEIDLPKDVFTRSNDYNTVWDYISDGQKFKQVATNPATDRVWGVLYPGGKIAEYNPNLGRWIEDKTMPKSVSRLAVDSNGRPAMT